MNNHIIDPSVFYWINVLSIVQTVLAVLGTCLLIGSFSLTVTYIYQRYMLSKPEKPDTVTTSRYDIERYQRDVKAYEDNLQHIAMFRKWMVVTAVFGILLVLASIFIPGKQTSIEMLVAKTATFDNVNWTVSQVKEIIDYIVSALKGAV